MCVSVAILSRLISVDFGHGSRFLITRSFMSIGFEILLNLNRNWMNRKSARLSKGMRIYIFETNNLSAYYAQSNNSTHDLTIKVFCILHQTYLFVHSVENRSKVIALDTWQLNTTKAWWLTKKRLMYISLSKMTVKQAQGYADFQIFASLC